MSVDFRLSGDANAAASSSSTHLQPAAANLSAASSSSSFPDLIDRSLHPSGIIPTLQNIVATVNLGCKLDLKSIAMRARNAEYNPRRFAAVIMRIRQPKTTALIFHSGKMVITGAKSEEQAQIAARKYARIIQKLGIAAVQFLDFTIQNIVGSCDVRFPIRLDKLAEDHEDFSSHEPELFPGLIYRLISPKIVLLIFVSGKVVLTGAKTRDEIYKAFETIYPVLTEYRKELTNQHLSAAQAQRQIQMNQAKASATRNKKNAANKARVASQAITS